jgi:plastocyanin
MNLRHRAHDSIKRIEENEMKKTGYILIAIAVAVVAGAGLSGAAAPAASDPQVKIDNFTFTPPAITVSAGTTVHWVNHDDIPHTVVSDDKSFKSKTLDTNDEFTLTFTKPGTYSYFCSIHPKMTGKVVVQ